MELTTAQLTDSELNQMMLDNNLEIVWSEAKGKWVLNRKHGPRAVFLKSSTFKSLLYLAVKKINQHRIAKKA